MDNNKGPVRHRKLVHNDTIREFELGKNFFAIALCNEDAYRKVLEEVHPSQILNIHELYEVHSNEIPTQGYQNWIIPRGKDGNKFWHLKRANSNNEFKAKTWDRKESVRFFNLTEKFFIPLRCSYSEAASKAF